MSIQMQGTRPAVAKTQKGDAFVVAAMLAGIPVIIVSFLASSVLVGAWKAFVIFKLYGWFLTSLGAPLLNWWHIWGLLLIYSAVTMKFKPAEPRPEDREHPWARLLGAFVTPLSSFAFILLIGWLIKTWGLS